MIYALVLAATLIENVIAVTNAAAQIDAAIVAKGGTTAGGLTNAPAAIAALPTGGTTRPYPNPYASYGWPDIRDILDADDPYGDGIFTEEQVPRNAPRHIVLYFGGITIRGFTAYNAYYRTSDGDHGRLVYNGVISLGHIPGKQVAWVIFYDATGPIPYTNGGTQSKIWIYTSNDTRPISHNFNYYFYKLAIGGTLDVGHRTLTATGNYAFNLARMAADAYVITGTATIDGVSASVSYLVALPDVFSVPDTASKTYSLSGNMLGRYPTNMTARSSVTFANAKYADQQSLVQFDAGDNIVGGMLYNLNVNDTGHALTLTLNNTIKTELTDAQKTAVESLVQTVKGWTLAW